MWYISLIFLLNSILFISMNHAMDNAETYIPLMKVDANQRSSKGQKLLSAVHTDNNNPAVIHLIEGGADLNIIGENGETPLIKAIKNGAINVAKKLIDAGADVNLAGNNKITPLMWAVPDSDLEIIEKLILAGADINSVDMSNNTALFYAVVYGKNQIARFLISRDADVDIASHMNKDGVVTPIMYAIFQNNKEQVRDLLEAGADFYVFGQNDSTLFSLAADKPEILEMLKNFRNQSFIPPEMHQEKDRELLGLVSLENLKNENVNAVKKIVSEGARINIIDEYKITPLLRAIIMGHLETAKFLIAIGADVNIRSTTLITPLISAVTNGYIEIVKMLIAANANLDLTDGYNNTALFHAVRSKYDDIAKVLIKSGADVNIAGRFREQSSQPPLYVAVLNQNIDLVRELVNAGADIYAKGPEEKSIMVLAEQIDNQQILEFLKEQEMSDIGLSADSCSILVTPKDDIIERIMQDMDKIGNQGYIGLESPMLSNMKLITKLKEAVFRGVTIHIYIDPLHKQYSKISHIYKDHLINVGIKVFEVSDLHTKRILIAEKKPEYNEINSSTVSYIGSMNFSENAPDNIELMIRCVDDDDFLQNYTNQTMLESGQYNQQVFFEQGSEKGILHSMKPETNKKKIDLIKELPTCKHSDDMMYIASMTLSDKGFLEQVLRAQKEFFKPIKIILDAESWQEERIRNVFLKPLVQAGADVYIYNKEGNQQTLKEFEKLFHIKALLRICNQQCTAVISTGNLTERNKKTINYDYWQQCSKVFSDDLKDILDRIMQESEKLELSSFN